MSQHTPTLIKYHTISGQLRMSINHYTIGLTKKAQRVDCVIIVFPSPILSVTCNTPLIYPGCLMSIYGSLAWMEAGVPGLLRMLAYLPACLGLSPWIWPVKQKPTPPYCHHTRLA